MHGHYGPPIGSRLPRVEWSVTPKDERRDSIIFVAPYYDNGARQTGTGCVNLLVN